MRKTGNGGGRAMRWAVRIGMLLMVAGALTGCRHAAPAGPKVAFNADYPTWSTVLARYADEDGVNYAGLQLHGELMDATLEAMRGVRRADFDGWSLRARLAFLINAHNAFAVERVLREYPVPSIEKTRFLGSALNVRDIRLLGREWSLRELEQEVMSERYLESRAVFLLNWAEAGCAPLPRVAVTEHNLPDLLERETRRFLAMERNCQYDARERVIYLSPLIDTYTPEIRRDFTTMWQFLGRYLPPEQAEQVKARPPRLRWLEFDTSLNDANLAPVTRVEPPATSEEIAPERP